MAGLLVAGTSSDAGKSLVVTALCRAARRRGVDVAPFKAQNMSNNSMVCRDGAEIGRAQYLQCQAAGVEATALHNPVLLKPGSDREAFVVLRGRPAGVLRAGEYTTGRGRLAAAAFEAYAELARTADLVVCEGAGSPAEVNLRENDYVNLGLAREFGLPVVLVGDVDRGGVLAALYGTWAILDEADRAHLSGYVVNKFRGDPEVLAPGLDTVTRRTGMPSFGVLPWLPEVWLDSEDAVAPAGWGVTPDVARDRLSVAVVRLPRASNATDVDALAAEPGVDVVVTADPSTCRAADLLVLPGTRATVADLDWLRGSGLAAVVTERATREAPVLGVCGGYQMLCRVLDDPVESGRGRVEGLGLLPYDVGFAQDKVLARRHTTWEGLEVEGYEIHHGVVDDDASFPGGTRTGALWGTIWHGTLESDAFRRAWLAQVAAAAGSAWTPQSGALGFAARREAMLDRLADALEEHVDVDALLALADRPVG